MMRRVLILCMTLAWAALCLPGAESAEAELAKLLAEANTLFRQGNDNFRNDPAAARDFYQRATLRYERIVREGGIRNGKLFYNLGNAYFRSGDVGRAILNYRRAELHLSGDANLAQSLEYALQSRPDKFEEKQETQVLKTLLFWHYDLSPGVRALLLVIFSGAFWIGLALRLWRVTWAPKAAVVVTGLIAALLLGSLLAETVFGSGTEGGVIVAEQVIARKGDGLSYEPSFTEPLHTGTEFQLLDARADWYQIELPDGRQCWIPSTSAGLVHVP